MYTGHIDERGHIYGSESTSLATAFLIVLISDFWIFQGTLKQITVENPETYVIKDVSTACALCDLCQNTIIIYVTGFIDIILYQ